MKALRLAGHFDLSLTKIDNVSLGVVNRWQLLIVHLKGAQLV